MTISRWLIVLMCAGSAMVGSIFTVVVHSDSACTAMTEQQRQQHDADASFEVRPNTRGGVKGY
ncbi:hypothetical protein CC207_09305 [Pseudomonas sp. DrBHI1]|nr:hypothetical protein CC207_09305 [Pseudomonas sp. DrBHI1]